LEERLLKLGIGIQYKYKGQTHEKQGISFKMGNVCFKGSQIDRKYSLAGLQKAFAQQIKPELEPSQKRSPDSFPLSPRQRQFLKKHATQAPTSGSESSPVPHLGQGMVNILKTLLDPIGDGGGPTPYELTEEAKRKKKKKKGQRPH
jgi:hypothetical protein